jgi:hypothetical protein
MKVVEISGQVDLATVAPTEGASMTGTMGGTVMETTTGSDTGINTGVSKR